MFLRARRKFFIGSMSVGILFFCLIFPAQTEQDLLVKTWMIEDGLPQNSVTSICQTGDGYIWLGTEMGLARFNGTGFRIFNRWNTPQLRENRITALAEDSMGKLWVGTDGGGIVSYAGDIWKSYGREEGLPGLSVRTIVSGKDGSVWAGTESGLAVLKEGRWTKEEVLPAEDVTACIMDGKGRLWAGGRQGVWRQVPKNGGGTAEWTGVTEEPVHCLLADQRGQIFMGTAAGLKITDENSGRKIGDVALLAGNDISCLWADADGAVWAGSRGGGLLVWQKGVLQKIGPEEGLGDKDVQACRRDRQGNLWVGTMTGGLSRIKMRGVRLIRCDEILPGGVVQAVLEDGEGMLWIATRQGLCRRSAGGIWNVFTTQHGLPDNDVRAVCKTKTGTIWIGTKSGLASLDNQRPGRFVPAAGLLGVAINIILEDRRGVLWVGAADGLHIMDADNRSFTEVKPLLDLNIRTLAEDGEGRLWIGTSRGLYAGTDDWLEPLLPGENVLALATSHARPGLVWVGLEDGGMAAVEKGAAIRFKESDGLLSNKISALLETPEGELWVGSGRGIFRIGMDGMRERLSGHKSPLNVFFLNDEDGIIRGECSDGGQPLVWPGAGGILYFAVPRGVVVVDPLRLRPDLNLPPAVIDEVRLDNRSLPIKSRQVISPGQHLLEFYFSALDFTAPSKSRLMYLLSGFDTDWKQVQPGRRGSALYYSLNSGRYRFRIRAAGADGRWNAAETVYSFQIQSSFPLLLIVIPLLILFTAGAGLFAWRRRRQRPEPQEEAPRKKYQTSALTEDRAEEIIRKLTEAIEEEKVYLNPSLTLKKLSEQLLIHPNHLSRIINERYSMNFNDYINRYRIEEAKRLLLDPDVAKKTILDIAYEVGFFSKSVFNTAFKKFTGLTPSEFREEK